MADCGPRMSRCSIVVLDAPKHGIASPCMCAAADVGTPGRSRICHGIHRRHAEWMIERIGREATAVRSVTATLITLNPAEQTASGAGLPSSSLAMCSGGLSGHLLIAAHPVARDMSLSICP